MNLKNTEKKEKNTVLLTIEIGAEEFNAAVDKVYRKAKNSLSVPGFRKGKAPRKLVEKMYGADIFYEDAINDLYPAALDDAIKEVELEVVGYPQLNLEHVGPDGVLFTALLGIKPEVKLGQYKGVEAPKAAVEVTDEDVENELKPLIARATTEETVERPAENGDSAIIDFEGFKDGVPFEGGKAEQYSLKLGSGSFIPGFEDQVVGMTAGEEKDINVTFPEDYGEESLAGAPVVFKIKLHEVKAEVAPELDDEFAKDVSEFETLDELKADLRSKVEKRKSDSAQKNFEAAVMAKVIANAEMEVPDTMVEYELDQEMDSMEQRMQGYGIQLDQYFSMMGTNRAEFRENQRTSALLSVQNELVLEAVAAAENIEISEEEIDAEIQRMAEQYDMEADDVRDRVPVESLTANMKIRKASDLIVAAAVAVEPSAAVEAQETEEAPEAEEAQETEETAD